MQANHIYMIRGASTANSPFFEQEQHCHLFLQLAQRFLADYVNVLSFQNNRDGWIMIISTHGSREIKKAYYTRRSKSKKCKKEFEYKEVWQMLSDQIRILLSTYVKATNRMTGRTGGKVRHRFERFIFDTMEEAIWMRDLLERVYYVQAQPRKRYQPSKRLHKIKKKLLRKSIYVCCFLLRIPEELRKLGMRCLDLEFLDKDIARHYIHRTIHHHFPT